MKYLSMMDAAIQACAHQNMWGVYFSAQTDDPVQILEAAPWLKSMPYEAQIEGAGMVLFSTETEARALYAQTVGDDGPTKTNPYEGTGRVYAMIVDNRGRIITENT